MMLVISFTPFPELATARTLLRQLQPSDDTDILRLRSDERVNRYLTRTPCKTLAEARAFINKINKGILSDQSIYWGIMLKESGSLVGAVCLWNLQPENYRAEVGYELMPEFWGRGLAEEVLRAVVDYGFETMKLHSLEANLAPGNAASIKLLERVGFVREGWLRENSFFNGKFCDTIIYSLLNKKS